MVYVVIVNGRPRSGKTQFEEYCKEYAESAEIANVYIDSTINPIKEIYKMLGWDGVSKTDEDRNTLHMLKNIWVNKCNGAIRYMANRVIEVFNKHADEDNIIFFDIREEDQINSAVSALCGLSEIYPVRIKTVVVIKHDVNGKIYGNMADDGINEFTDMYDTLIANITTLADLKVSAVNFIDMLIEEE